MKVLNSKKATTGRRCGLVLVMVLLFSNGQTVKAAQEPKEEIPVWHVIVTDMVPDNIPAPHRDFVISDARNFSIPLKKAKVKCVLEQGDPRFAIMRTLVCGDVSVTLMCEKDRPATEVIVEYRRVGAKKAGMYFLNISCSLKAT